jgi:AmmeMemoRadiSam system protein A
MSAPEPVAGVRHAETLLGVARASIERGLRDGRALELDPRDFPPELREPGAAFVTLRRHGELRGCTGSLEAVRPLVVEVARMAHRSAFGDPRFPGLAAFELFGLEIEISILSRLSPLAVDSEQALLAQLRPSVDGLVLREGSRSSTFLPAVWKSLPAPRDFLAELKRKAGLPPDYWSPTLRFERYTAAEIS